MQCHTVKEYLYIAINKKLTKVKSMPGQVLGVDVITPSADIAILPLF